MIHKGRNPAGWLFVAPALFLLIIWLIYPTLWTIRLSLYGGPGFVPTRFVGLDNYINLFTQDPSFLDLRSFPPSGALINNIIWLFILVPLTVGLGLAIAVLADKVRYESFIKSVVFLPYGISATAAGIIWLFVYSPNANIGLLNALFGVVIPNWQPLSYVGDA